MVVAVRATGSQGLSTGLQLARVCRSEMLAARRCESPLPAEQGELQLSFSEGCSRSPQAGSCNLLHRVAVANLGKPLASLPAARHITARVFGNGVS